MMWKARPSPPPTWACTTWKNFIAIVNPPEAAILAISSAREVPVVENGEIKAGWRMKATISVDHRVSDGAEAAQFMQALAPVLMLV
jgi:pyruvate dehydrogenase E2 component (dihydrolipoamide acetyltransferase)